MRNMLLTVSDVSHRWQPDLKGNEGKENALTSGNLPRPSAGTYNKALLQMAVLEQRNHELTEEVTLLRRRNYELMDQNTYALEKVKRQKRVMKTQKRTIETLQIEREERPTADVRAPCTAALHRYARHAGATPSLRRPPALLRPRFCGSQGTEGSLGSFAGAM